MTTKTVYQCDAAGVYVGTASAFESPFEAGVYHIPARCVEAAPPEIADGAAAVWSGDGWTVVPDHRGETWYLDGVAIRISMVGDPSLSGYLPAPPAPTLDELRASKIKAITDTAAALLSAGAPAGANLHVALDDGSRADLTAMATTATAAAVGSVEWPESYSRGWIAIENVRIPLPDPADGLALAASVGNFYAAIVQRRRDLKDAALATEGAAELSAIDIAAGWPD
jgi:hypothetical protein